MPDRDHAYWMRHCLDLAAKGAGTVSPNPMVGAVLVGSSGEILGEGWHQQYGGPHAEPQAIDEAQKCGFGDALSEATLYVNLEPCAHHGKTPPCVDRVLAARIPRVVIGMVDPFPRVQGRSIERMRAAGVALEVGVLSQECERLNTAFIHHIKTGRPFVTLKMAQTLDAQVATHAGDARWVSGRPSRSRVHEWRAHMDGVLVGQRTAALDDPSLTVRHVSGRQPRRFVLDKAGQLPDHLALFTDDHAHLTTVIVGPDVAQAYRSRRESQGADIIQLPLKNGHLDLGMLLQLLGKGEEECNLPLQSLLIEAGPQLASAFIQEGLVDRLALFIAPKLLGEGLAGWQLPGKERMDEALTFLAVSWEQIGDDVLFLGDLHLPPAS